MKAAESLEDLSFDWNRVALQLRRKGIAPWPDLLIKFFYEGKIDSIDKWMPGSGKDEVDE